MPPDLTDEQLLYLVGTTDKELFDGGMDIGQRSLRVPAEVMKKLGYISFVIGGLHTPPIYDRIYATFCSIYRAQDLAIGGHIGVFMYRDIFARIGVPHAYGTVSINPFECVELTPVQLRIIQTEPDQVQLYIDQFCDVADVQYGSTEIKTEYAQNELARRYLGLARLHLHSAAAVLTGGYDFRGAVQAALLATELGLKAGAASLGMQEDDIRNRFGHRASEIASHLGAQFSAFDEQRVQRAINAQPQFVANRYSATQPPRREVGHLVMSAQYIVAEVVRQLSDRDFRRSLNPPYERTYPAWSARP
jgi:hypothetical protein